MTRPESDDLAQLCEQLQNDTPERAELERALLVLCEQAMQQEDDLVALTATLRENATRARALETQIKTGVRAA